MNSKNRGRGHRDSFSLKAALFFPFVAVRDWFADALGGDDSIRDPEGNAVSSLISVLTLPLRLLFGFAVFMVQAWSTSRRGRAFLLGLPAVFTIVGCAGLLWVTTFFFNRFTLARSIGFYRYYSQAENGVPENELMFARKWHQLKPDQEEVKYRVGTALDADGQDLLAVSLMKSLAPEDQPGFIPAHLWLARNYQRELIQSDSAEGVDDLVSRHLELVVEKDPANLDAQTSLSSQYQIRAFKAQKNENQEEYLLNLEKAEAALENVINPMFNPIRSQRVISVGQILQVPRLLDIKRKLGKEAGAIDKFDQLFNGVVRLSANYPDEIRLQIFIALRDSAVSVKDYDRAVAVLQQAFESFEDSGKKQAFIRSSARVLLLQADQYRDFKTRDEFFAHLFAICKSLNSNPTEREAYVRLIEIIDKIADNDEYLEWLKESLLTSPKLSLTHLLLGFNMIHEGDIQDGISHWKIAFRLESVSQSILNNIIDVASSDKEARIENMLDVNLIAIEMFDQPLLYQSLGMTYLRLGNIEQAAKSFETALEQRKGLLPSHFQLEKCYTLLGNTEKADFHKNKLEDYFDRLPADRRGSIRRALENL